MQCSQIWITKSIKLLNCCSGSINHEEMLASASLRKVLSKNLSLLLDINATFMDQAQEMYVFSSRKG